jgi:alpha-glucosidase
MPWTDAAPMGGFTSAADAWLPMDPAHLPLSIARQQGDPASMLAFTQGLLAVRKATAALRTGGVVQRESPVMVLAFERVQEGTRIGCCFELGGEAARVEAIGGEVIWSTGGAALAGGDLDLPPYAAAMIRL